MSFLIGAFEPSMLDEVADFRRTAFGGSLEFNRAYLTWKYFQNPYIGNPVFSVARKDGEIVGMRGWFGTSWQIPGKDAPTVIPHAAESAILPHHRHQGLFRELTMVGLEDLRQRGFLLVMSMSATENNYLIATEAMGWRSAGNFQSLAWLRDAGSEGDSATSSNRLRARVRSTKGVARLAKVTKRARNRIIGSSEADPFRNLEDHLGRPGTALRMERAPRPSVMAQIASSDDDGSRIIHTRDEE